LGRASEPKLPGCAVRATWALGAAWLLVGCVTTQAPPVPDLEQPQSGDRAAEALLVERLESLGPATLRWSLMEHGCVPNWRAECSEPPLSAPPPSPDGMQQRLPVYAQYLTLAAVGPERARRALEYGELLMVDEQIDQATPHLRGVLEMQQLDAAVRARAGRLLVEGLLVLWMRSTTDATRLELASRLRALLIELQRDRTIWESQGEDGAALRELAQTLGRAAGWDIAMAHRQIGLESGEREAFAACLDEFLNLFNTYEDHPDGAFILSEAAECASRAYQIGASIQIREGLVDRFPDSARAPDALFAVAETYQSVLSYREALARYRVFSERHADDYRATIARTRWLQLAVTLGDPVADIVATWQVGTLDERMLAAAVEFRSARRSGDIEAMSAYLDRYRTAGGPAREAAARVALAADLMRRSCPDTARATGLCTLQTADGRLGEVLRRNDSKRSHAQRELRIALALMRDPAWRDDPVGTAGPPLALEAEELLTLEATAALLVGDLSAEEALGVQPPRTYEASRTRMWLKERKSSVAAMITSYEQVGVNDAARAAAVAERTAQVYESDATLLSRVGLELRDRGELELAAQLEQLEVERLSQALAAYQQCLAAIAAYGDDPSNVQHACKLGVGRLCGHYDVEVPFIGTSSLGTLMLGTN
jgi:tetratricopeptide (TPR) repeat protein